MNYWDSVGRWINTLLLFIVGIVSFDTLFRLLEAQDGNIIVSVVRVLAALVLVPFQGMFSEQDYVLTALIAVLGYTLLVGIALAVLRSLQATRPPRQPAYERQPGYEQPVRPAAESQRNRQYRAAAKPARSAGAAPSNAAPRPPARRATKRPDPPAAPAPTAKPPTRNPPVRRAATTQSRPEVGTGNGRKPPSQTDGAAASRGSGSAAGTGDRATAGTADTARKSPTKATAPAATRAADTTPPRKAKPADRDE
jgi:hypothetical protein